VILADSHCHLDDRQFDTDRAAAIARARAAGVQWLLAVGTGHGPPDIEAGLRLAAEDPFILASAGVHPHDASKADESTFRRLATLLAHPKVVALGEVGLDYHYDFSPRPVQQAVFRRQLEIARAGGKPVIVHTREAWDDTLLILREAWGGEGIMHCFTGDERQARQALDLGFHLAFGGVLTFPKADRVRAAARLTPSDRLLVETDCPYLAPVPHRGRRNEPAWLPAIVERLAAERGEQIERLAESTTANFLRLCLRRAGQNG
jgi:TatD DNase family protein